MNLIAKYNVPGPRYTSYPTVPYWDGPIAVEDWQAIAKKTFDATNQQQGISLYIHLPYCESLCTYCGCNTRITVNHNVETPYIEAVLLEWQQYIDLFGSKPRIREIHLGGGTPTFFSPENLEKLISGLLKPAELLPDYRFSFEAHPNNTTREHLQTLASLGFDRVSYGIQDFDPKVQKAIHRIQTFEQVETAFEEARKAEFKSINTDLIYGLPFQTLESVQDTMNKVEKLAPERIAFYSYAHVPWVKPGQRHFTEMDLPTDEYKRSLYELGKARLEAAGYHEIGMDHFALPGDELYKAAEDGTLHRNFMGYTPGATSLMIGLGVSSISDAWGAFAQNVKVVEPYIEKILAGQWPQFRGHILNEEDLFLRRIILDLMCRFEARWKAGEELVQPISGALERLSEMEVDGLVELNSNGVKVTPKGRKFIRNICMAFDARLWEKQPDKQIFSTTV